MGSEAALLCLRFVARDGLLRPYETGIRPLEVAVALRALHLPTFAHVLPPMALQSAIVRRRPARWEEARSRKTCSRSGCSMLFNDRFLGGILPGYLEPSIGLCLVLLLAMIYIPLARSDWPIFSP